MVLAFCIGMSLSLASIEEMRTPAYEISEKGVKLALTESQIPHLQRTPFADLN